mgnify:CR=1 FL=1
MATNPWYPFIQEKPEIAWGALKPQFGPQNYMDYWNKQYGNVYDKYMGRLGLLAVAWAAARWPGQATHAAGWLFLAGIVLFSGSLYGLSLSGVRALGAITPLGGVAFIAGWLTLAWAIWQG